jgi:polyisoprenoid-binding protein YceI
VILNFRAFVAGFAIAIAIPAAAQESYVLDPVHSQPNFEARHIGLSVQRGSFGKAAGKVTLDRAAKKGTVDVTIDTASIRSFDARLDAALKGEKFFNVEKFPTMTFKSGSVTFDGDRVVGVDGELTMIGVTRPVKLKVADFVCAENPFNKKPMCGAEATATIKRSEFGMTTGLPYAPADDVRIVIPIEAYRE